MTLCSLSHPYPLPESPTISQAHSYAHASLHMLQTGSTGTQSHELLGLVSGQ